MSERESHVQKIPLPENLGGRFDGEERATVRDAMSTIDEKLLSAGVENGIFPLDVEEEVQEMLTEKRRIPPPKIEP